MKKRILTLGLILVLVAVLAIPASVFAATTVNAIDPAWSATNSTVVASPLTVLADNTTTSTVTVTLLDASSAAVSGVHVGLTAGSGSSSITGSPGITNGSGVATFTVEDGTVESVTYTATDTDASITIGTASVTFHVGPTASVSTPPGNVSLTLLNNPSAAKQIVAVTISTGVVTASNYDSGYTYSLKVTASNSGKLTQSSEHLNNALMIATGDSTNHLGNVTAAGALTAGVQTTDVSADFTALDGSAQTIGASLTSGMASLSLYVMQKIDSGETRTAGTYSLTLTYTVSNNF